MRPTTLTAAAPLLATATAAFTGQTLVSPALQTGSNTSGLCFFRNGAPAPIVVKAAVLKNVTPTARRAEAGGSVR
jgi:hypothetical protein